MVTGGLDTGGGSSPAAGVRRSSTACRCLRHWCGWRPGRHCACPAAGTRCSHVRCGPGVVFFRSDQSGVKAPVLEVFDYCSCDFTCVFVLPEEKENHFPMQCFLNILCNTVSGSMRSWPRIWLREEMARRRSSETRSEYTPEVRARRASARAEEVWRRAW